MSKHFQTLYMITLLLMAFATRCCVASGTLQSPDGQIRLSLELVADNQLSQLRYEISYKDQPVVAPSTISFLRSDGCVIGNQLSSIAVGEPIAHHSVWTPVYGERRQVIDHYNQLVADFYDEVAKTEMRVVFRCYDAGVAFRVELNADVPGEGVAIEQEQSEFHFLDDHTAWCTSSAQGEYRRQPISSITGQVERPLVLRTADDIYVAVAEAKLVDYARMRLRRCRDRPHCIVSQLSGGVRSSSPLKTPWRVVMLGKTPGELLENNDILLNLNEPCQIDDTSWIQPGKVLREITLTTEGGKECVDFAVEHNFQFVEFDAGWYGHEYNDSSDATTVTVDPQRSDGPLDLQAVIDYAKARDVGVIVYVNRRALETQLDDLLPLYKEWGIAGVKYGFVNVGAQDWTSWLHEAVRKAAKHELMVDIHDEYRPTGYSRTYPNLMTQEGVRGDESTPSTEQSLTTIFTRSLAGAADATVCYSGKRVDENWSHGYQLAKTVCIYSPWQFLLWYDTPVASHPGNRIVKTPELEFFKHVPTTWDETRVVHGCIGKYAVIARRRGGDWFVGAMNSSTRRSLDLPLDFLDDGQEYQATIYADDASVNTATQVGIKRVTVAKGEHLELSLGANEGLAIRLTPTVEPEANTDSR